MLSLCGILALSFGLSLLLTPLVRGAARNLGLVDRPDGRRKIHSQAVPVAGGIAVFIAACLALVAPLLMQSVAGERLSEQVMNLAGLFLASLLICAVGVVDDMGLLRGRHKLIGQCLAVAVLIGFGVIVRSVTLFDHRLELGPLAIPFTVFLLLGAINSLNLIDGMDGLLGSVGIIISLALAAIAVLSGHIWAAAVALALAGSLLGFLRYNYPPASIFLGDSGSMLVGLVLGTLAIQSSLKGPATIALAAPVALLTIPIFDTTAAILRRKLTGRSIYTTDRGHLHHCLLRHGFSTHRVILLISGMCLLTSLGALASLAFNNELYAVVTAAAVIGILLVSRLFGGAEVVLVKERLASLGSSFLQSGGHGKTRELEVQLQGTGDWKDLWRTLTASAEQLNLKQMRLDVNAPATHEGYHARWDRLGQDQEVPNTWRAEIPLTASGHAVGRLKIAGPTDDEPVWVKIATVGKLVEDFELAMQALAPGIETLPEVSPPSSTNHLLTEFTPHSGPAMAGLNQAVER